MELLRKAADSPRLEQPQREVVQAPEAVAEKRRLHELGWGTRMMTAADPCLPLAAFPSYPDSGHVVGSRGCPTGHEGPRCPHKSRLASLLRHYHELAVTHAALGNYVIRHVLHVFRLPFQHRHLQAALGI